MNNAMIDDIKDRIGEERFNHSVRVAETAEKLAFAHNEEIEKAYRAGLLHDCGKIRNKEILLRTAKDFGIELDEILLNSVELIHAPLGAKIAKLQYGEEDEDILNAIKYHTTGRANMSKLEKIIFLADYTEPLRNFVEVENVRDIAYESLDKAIILSIEQTIKFLIARGNLIDRNSIEARNDLIIKNKGE